MLVKHLAKNEFEEGEFYFNYIYFFIIWSECLVEGDGSVV